VWLIAFLNTHLKSYQSAWERGLFGLSMLGLLTVAHLAIQDARGFDRGCFGFSAVGSGTMGFDCSAVVSSPAGALFGVSNIPMSLGFYGMVAALTVAIFGLSPRWRRWVHAGRVALIAAGTGYAGYLVYVQAGALGTFCALCLVSAAVTVLLLIGQGLLVVRAPQSRESTFSARLYRRDLATYVYLAALTAVLVGADLVYFEGLPPAQAEQVAARDRQFSGAACQLDPQRESVDPSRLVHAQDLTLGPSEATVTVIEYFDPNCPRCKTFHETMSSLISAYEGEVRFVFKPFPLQGSALPEIQALYVADQQGKFWEMLDAQYARQRPSGLNAEDLRAIAEETAMNPDELLAQIAEDEHRQHVLDQRKRAIEIGVESAPTVLVNGHFVASRSLECMKTVIERAKSGQLASGAAR